MNGSGKQSFYEIQLNNSSLIVAFVIAVGLGIGIFMLGVMVGRGQAPTTPVEEGWVEDTFAPADGPAAVAETAGEDTDPDLDFFEQVEEPAPGQAAAEQAAPPTARQQEQPAEAPVSTPPAVTPPTGMPAADPSLATGWVVQVKATPRQSEAEALQAALAAAGFPAFVISADSGSGTVYRVRVGRYGDRADAERVDGLLRARDDIADTWVTEG